MPICKQNGLACKGEIVLLKYPQVPEEKKRVCNVCLLPFLFFLCFFIPTEYSNLKQKISTNSKCA